MAHDLTNLEEIFSEALRRSDPGERDLYLEHACGTDCYLRCEIDALLSANSRAGSFLQTNVATSEAVDDAFSAGLREQIGRYRLDGEIARGGMGVILKGRDTDLGRNLAIKVLLDQHKDKPEVIRRFVKEAQIGGQLQHPGIAPIYELGQFADKRPFFAMKLVRGETLSKLLANRKDPAEDRGRFIGIFRQVCQTMAYAHSCGVIHRDLKPANIMVGAFGEVQVIDWGLAKVLAGGGVADEKKAHDTQQGESVIQTIRNEVDSGAPETFGSDGSQTRMGSVIGTPAFMSPEQALGEIDNLDERADVFGLGAILCKILTGKPPYVADDGARVIRMASCGTLEYCFQRLESCGADEDLVALTKHCLELEPADRPRHAGVLAERVTEYAESVETRLREAEIERAAAAARADAEGRRAEAERQRAESETRRVEQQQRSTSKLRKMLSGMAVVALVAGFAFVAAFIAHKRSNDLALIARKNEADANFFAGEATAKAKLASENATRAEAAAALARNAEQSSRELAKAEAAARSLAQQETQRAEVATAEAKTQLTRSERLLYASRLMLAQTDFESGNGGLALHYLNESQQNLRGWEYRYLSTRINALQTLAGHTSAVNGVAYSPDGKRIVTGSYDNTAKVWNAETGLELITLKGHTNGVTSVAYSLDGQRIVTGSFDNTAKVWNAETGLEFITLKGHSNGVTSVAYSLDGQRIVTGSLDKTAKVWDAATGQELFCLTDHAHALTSVAFSPDSRWIVTGSMDSTAKVWDAAKGDVLLTLNGHPGAFVYRALFSPDGNRIVTISNDRTAKVWDAEKGQEVLVLKGHTNAVASVAFSPDGQRIVTGSWDQTIKVWASQTGEEVFTLKGHADQVLSVAFSPDGRRILSGSPDKTARVWDVDNGQEIPTFKVHQDTVTSMVFSSDSQRLVMGGSLSNTVIVWNAISRQEVLRFQMHPNAPAIWDVAGVRNVAISRDGQRIAAASKDKTARVWDVNSGKELLVLKHAHVVMSVAFSPDGKRLVTGDGRLDVSDSGGARLWDATTGEELLAFRGHTNNVTSVAFSPDGQRIVTGSWDHTAKVWDAATAEEFFTLRGHAGYVMSVVFSPDGKKIVTGGYDNAAKVWDAATGQEILTLTGHTGGAVRSVAFSPDGARIVTGSDDRTAKIWDANTGHEVLTLGGHTEAVYSVAWSPDGNRIITGIAGTNATARLWNAATARELLVLSGHTEPVTHVAFSDDGQRVFAWDKQKTLLAWSVLNGEPIAPLDPPPEPLPGPASSPDGFHHAVPEGNTVVVSDTSPLPENAWPLPNVVQRIRYHAEKAALAKQQDQTFAARFHLQQVAFAETELVREKRFQSLLPGDAQPTDNAE